MNIIKRTFCLFTVILTILTGISYASTHDCLSPVTSIPTSIDKHVSVISELGYISRSDKIEIVGFDERGLFEFRRKITDKDGWITYKFANSRPYWSVELVSA